MNEKQKSSSYLIDDNPNKNDQEGQVPQAQDPRQADIHQDLCGVVGARHVLEPVTPWNRVFVFFLGCLFAIVPQGSEHLGDLELFPEREDEQRREDQKSGLEQESGPVQIDVDPTQPLHLLLVWKPQSWRKPGGLTEDPGDRAEVVCETNHVVDDVHASFGFHVHSETLVQAAQDLQEDGTVVDHTRFIAALTRT